MEVSSQRHAPAALPPGKEPGYPLLVWPLDRCGEENLFFLPGSKPRILQPVAGPVSTVLSWPAVGVRCR